MATLNEALTSMTGEDLKAYTRRFLPIRLVSTRKAEFVHEISDYLLSEDGLLYVWNHLTELEQNAVREIIYDSKPIYKRRKFIAKYGEDPLYGQYSSRNESHLSWIIYGPRYGSSGTIPVDLVTKLRKFVEKPLPAKLKSIDELPRTVKFPDGTQQPLEFRNTEDVARYELTRMLRLAEAGALSASAKTKRPSIGTVKKCSESLVGGDFYEVDFQEKKQPGRTIQSIRAFSWPMLLQTMKFAKVHGIKLKLTEAGVAALAKPPESVIRDAWSGWLSHTTFDEFSRIDIIKGQNRRRGMYAALTAPSSRRFIVDAALKECAGGNWVSFEDLSRHIGSVGIDISVADDPWNLYVCEPEYGSLGYDRFHDWDIIEEPYLLCLLFEYAATLGLIDIAYTRPDGARTAHHRLWGIDDAEFFSQYDGLQFIRLTPLGKYCLGLTDSYEPSGFNKKSSIRLLPDLRLEVVSGKWTLKEQIFIENFALPESDSIWCLDRAKCAEALESELTIDSLREFLSEREDQPLPEKVEGFLRNMETNAHALKRVGETVLYEAVDAEVAKHISEAAQTKKYCRFIYENNVGIRAGSEQLFQEAVHQLGYGIRKK